jgi:hypothetical protein
MEKKEKGVVMYRTDGALQALYLGARRRALARRLGASLWGSCHELMPFQEVYPHLKDRLGTFRGVQQVPLSQITGSAGKSRQFDLGFNPLVRAGRPRWIRVIKGMVIGEALPPVRLVRIGEAYFVEDGHHRISAARAAGWESIFARVHEMDTDGLKPEPACTRLGFKIVKEHRRLSESC